MDKIIFVDTLLGEDYDGDGEADNIIFVDGVLGQDYDGDGKVDNVIFIDDTGGKDYDGDGLMDTVIDIGGGFVVIDADGDGTVNGTEGDTQYAIDDFTDVGDGVADYLVIDNDRDGHSDFVDASGDDITYAIGSGTDIRGQVVIIDNDEDGKSDFTDVNGDDVTFAVGSGVEIFLREVVIDANDNGVVDGVEGDTTYAVADGVDVDAAYAMVDLDGDGFLDAVLSFTVKDDGTVTFTVDQDGDGVADVDSAGKTIVKDANQSLIVEGDQRTVIANTNGVLEFGLVVWNQIKNTSTFLAVQTWNFKDNTVTFTHQEAHQRFDSDPTNEDRRGVAVDGDTTIISTTDTIDAIDMSRTRLNSEGTKWNVVYKDGKDLEHINNGDVFDNGLNVSHSVSFTRIHTRGYAEQFLADRILQGSISQTYLGANSGDVTTNVSMTVQVYLANGELVEGIDTTGDRRLTPNLDEMTDILPIENYTYNLIANAKDRNDLTGPVSQEAHSARGHHCHRQLGSPG